MQHLQPIKRQPHPLLRVSRWAMCITPLAQQVMERYQVNPVQLIGRHVVGDWGDVCPEDAQANEDALEFGSRILSSYVLAPPTDESETLTSGLGNWNRCPG